jgi:DNA helicase-2/ATP-dependent DNA helicase PcrA
VSGRLSPSLAAELEDLNNEQARAATWLGSVVVSAGPGSGKTRTLVARAAYLLETQVSPFRGLACITYTTAAASEIKQRLGAMGVLTKRRVLCATAHSFCLNEILRPYADLTGSWSPGPGQVLSDADVAALLQDCFDQLAIADLEARYRTATATHIRRALACGEDLDSFDPREVAAAKLYEKKLIDLRVIDFDAMVSRAFVLVRSFPAVRDLLAARFPHLIVDEYQDMGGVLHRLVESLHDEAGIITAAVGDADQSIFGFTGADPRYLNELLGRDDFESVELEVNYRSGFEIIRVSEAALGRNTGSRRPRDGALDGDVRVVRVDGGLREHAASAVQVVQELAAEEPLHKIAILYPKKGPLLDALLASLREQDVPYLFERDESLAPGSISKFVQRCASRSVASYQARMRVKGEVVQIPENSDLHALESEYRRLRSESGLPFGGGRLWVMRALQDLLDPVDLSEPEQSAADWLAVLAGKLNLDGVAAAHPDSSNNECLDRLRRQCKQRELTVQDLAANIAVAGKVVLTTYHSSKGREFRSVVMPGLVNGVVPSDVNVAGRWQAPTGAALAEQRRGFFVAVSRAEEKLVLLTGSGFHTPYGRWIEKGPSSFLVEMQRRLRDTGAD